ncbi:LptF/LptG family permease [Thalassobellus citreus]|uniref:LptF/LptG family permease n=1 Tax=Thalassobellus citreus TaxID=3367752 RepID=UPI0037A3FB82
MKILDRYILTTYLKTFFSVFIILILIFILQSIWLYIKEFAGKDIGLDIMYKFVIYVFPKLIPLVLPLTILLSSIMVFGSFAENYEFAAMKSTGISLQRAMSGLSIFIVGVGIITFFFANNAIPWSEMKFYNLRRNIAKTKPSMAIVEGQFNQIEGTEYNIKVENKTGDNDQFLEDVTIHIKGGNGKTNAKTIKAKNGEFFYDESSGNLQLILFDGNYYEDLPRNDISSKNKKPFAKGPFEKDIINIDLSQLGNVDFNEESHTDRYNMLDIVDLDETLDSLAELHYKVQKGIASNLYTRSSIISFNKELAPDSKKDLNNTGPILNAFDTKNKYQIVDITLKSAISAKQIIDQKINSYKISKITFNRHIISFHEKFALGFACIILFFVGAPLGALIRKGGIGLPMVIAILLFLSYHFIGIFATNSGKSGDFNPVLASWFSTLIMLPLGIYLTKRATEDKGLFDTDSIILPLKKIFKIKEKEIVDYKFLGNYKDEELLNVISNYEELGHDENCRYEALVLLNKRGKTINNLRESGLSINKDYDISEEKYTDYKDHSKYSIILYCIGVVLLILHFVFNNNKLPSLATASIQLSLVSLILFLIYYLKSLINIFSFYKHVNKKEKSPNVFLLIIGIPLYFIVNLFLNVKMKEDLKLNCLDSLK